MVDRDMTSQPKMRMRDMEEEGGPDRERKETRYSQQSYTVLSNFTVMLILLVVALYTKHQP